MAQALGFGLCFRTAMIDRSPCGTGTCAVMAERRTILLIAHATRRCVRYPISPKAMRGRVASASRRRNKRRRLCGSKQNSKQRGEQDGNETPRLRKRRRRRAGPPENKQIQRRVSFCRPKKQTRRSQ
jgi:hypothetical protein